MKQNLLPDMELLSVKDRDGNPCDIGVQALRHDDDTYIFLSDMSEETVIARNSAVIINQLVKRLRLNYEKTQFVRHVHTAQSGSLFGRFNIQWDGLAVGSYTFNMLNNLDEADSIREVLFMGDAMPIAA
ncbi:hypothetical protein R50073_34340 [Maricurvus nonylphenolicus]|uniref:hypothetical protein n=1 Tax=Maricurvus nonylphenolicus TaxID=1008307 RepID=UPI0036F36387